MMLLPLGCWAFMMLCLARCSSAMIRAARRRDAGSCREPCEQSTGGGNARVMSNPRAAVNSVPMAGLHARSR